MTAADASTNLLRVTDVAPNKSPNRGAVGVEVIPYATPSHELWTPPMRLLPLAGSRESRTDRWIWTFIALGVASLYLYALLSFWAPANPGTDQNGYFVGGRQFAHTLSSGLKPESDYGFIGRMWVTAPSGVNYPKYPLGLPMLFATCLWIFGDRGLQVAHLISPVSAALATLGVFAITRRLAGGFVGVMAMLLLACGQVMLTLAVNPNSHAACVCAVVWAMFFLIRWLETGAIWRGIAAGALFGLAYTIRYTEGLLILPIGVAMIYAARWKLPTLKRGSITLGSTLLTLFAVGLSAWVFRNGVTDNSWLWPLADNHALILKGLLAAASFAAITSIFIETRSLIRILALGFAWLVPAAYLTIFNMVAMHTLTSYADTNESTGFDWDYFTANWEKMVRVIHDQGLFFIAPLGVLGLILMYRRLPLVATIFTLWFVPSVLLYSAYYWAPDNMGVAYSRFILTQLPALTIAAAWLLGEMGRRMRAPGVTMSLDSTAAKTTTVLAGVVLTAIGVGAIIYGSWNSKPHGTVDSGMWWYSVVPGAIAIVVGLSLAASRLSRNWRQTFDHQYSGATARLGIAFVVFISCSLGTYRTVLGSEWGQRMMIRANLEIQSRQNMNLAGLGDEVRRAVDGPAKDFAARKVKDQYDVLLFADGERLNHLQWIGGWQLFAVDSFNYDRMSHSLSRDVNDNDPDPIDPTRIKFLQSLYKGKDQHSLQTDENALIANALAAGKRVFYVLTDNSSKMFDRQIDRKQFDVKPVGTFNDVPPPRTKEDFLLPDEKPKLPVNRFGRGNAFAGPNFLGYEKMFFRIGQVTLRPQPAPASQPATKPTTKPATKPTTLPTTMP